MPRYYFDIHNGYGVTVDDCGDNLPNIEAAQKEASITAVMMAADRTKAGDLEDILIVVRDETGTEILTARASLTVEWTRRH